MLSLNEMNDLVCDEFFKEDENKLETLDTTPF